MLAVRAYLTYLRVWVKDLKELDTFGFYLQMCLVIFLIGNGLFALLEPTDVECVVFVASRTLLFPKKSTNLATTSEKDPLPVLSDSQQVVPCNNSFPVQMLADLYIWGSNTNTPKPQICVNVEMVGNAAVNLGIALFAARYSAGLKDTTQVGKIVALTQKRNDDYGLALIASRQSFGYIGIKNQSGQNCDWAGMQVIDYMRVCSLRNLNCAKEVRSEGLNFPVFERLSRMWDGPSWGLQKQLKHLKIELTSEEYASLEVRAFLGLTVEQNAEYVLNFPGFFLKNGSMAPVPVVNYKGTSLLTAAQSGEFDPNPNPNGA